MTIVPFDCIWHADNVEVFQTADGKNRYDHGIYTLISSPTCKKCGNPNLLQVSGEPVCFENYLHERLKDVDGVFQLGYYYKKEALSFKGDKDILTDHILALKKYWNIDYAKPLGKAMFLSIKNKFPQLLDADLIVPIPNHPDDPHYEVKAVALANEIATQFHQDGQHAEIAMALQKKLNISTHGLSRDEKERIVDNGMFEFNINKSVANKKVILVDDVLTNGIIKGKCASILKANGAAKIWGLVAGRNFSVPV